MLVLQLGHGVRLSGTRPALVALAVALGALHLALAGILELAPDEAYYWTWSRDFALVFPDHPPTVAWLVRAGTAIFGETPFGVRFWFVILGTALVPLSYAIARTAGAKEHTSLLVGAAVGTSFLGSAASLIATPDTPLAFGWAIGLLGIVGVEAGGLARGGRTLPWAFVVVGTAIAVASKLTGVLLPIVAVVGVASIERERRRATFLRILGAASAGLLLAAPIWLTDVGSGGGSIAFQLRHGLWAPDLGLGDRFLNLGAYAGAQIGLLTPLIAVAVAAFVARGSGPLRAAAAIPWLLFGCAALLAAPEANWPGVAHLAALAGAGIALDRAREDGRAWAKRRWVATAMGLQVALVAAVHVHLVRPFLPMDVTGDPTARLRGWSDLAARLRSRAEPVIAADYGIEAELRWHGIASVQPSGPMPRRVLWVAPVAGPSLPGHPAASTPAGCRSSEEPPIRVKAPVRVIFLECGAGPDG